MLRSQADERTHSRFDIYAPGLRQAEHKIEALFEDHRGVLWCGTDGGLFRAEWAGDPPRFEKVDAAPIVDLTEDRAGNLWAVAWQEGLLEIAESGEIRRYGGKEGIPGFVNQGHHYVWAYSLAVDGEGVVWAGTHGGLCRLRPNPAANGSIVDRVYTTEISSHFVINCLFVSRSGHLWVGSRDGAAEWTGDPRHPFRHWGAAEGITDRGVEAIGEDGAGNLWIATGDQGVKRIARDGLVSFKREDGLPSGNAFVETRKGEFLALSLVDLLTVNRFGRDRFIPIHPAFPPYMRWFGWGYGSIGFEDREGDWWLATGEGLCRFDGRGGLSASLLRSPKEIYTHKEGLASDEIFRVFEDSRGDIWMATNGPSSLSRWVRATGLLQKPPVLIANDRGFSALAEDLGGNVWIGTSVGIFRWRAGRLERVDRDGVPPDSASAIVFDHLGRLWLGNRQGLFRCDDPLEGSPRFQKILEESVGTVVEDRWGRIYAGTGRGILCLNPANGRMRRFTAADGLGPGHILSSYRDRRGDIWFGLTTGASRFTPQPDTLQPPAPLYITSVRSSGRNLPLAEQGETAVRRISLRPYENSVEVDFVGIELGMGRSLEYQYRLEGVQREWQALGNERSIHFASLSPGSYRVLVRAINTDGVPTDPPASVDLFVATPVWQSWWSLTLMAIAFAIGIYGAHRRRMRQALELERVRMRIATDLHDDVGASLSQVAIMSEVVSRGDTPDRKALAEIAGASRAVLQSMSEIVWAIDPSHDRLNDLARRMRWFAGETLSGCGVALHFSLEERAPEIRLGLETRRQVFLIFKECVNNLARHARARHAHIAMKLQPDELLLEVHDDGCGFGAAESAGHGLRNMALRARALSAAFEVESQPGEGSRIRLRIPLKRRRRRLWRSDTA